MVTPILERFMRHVHKTETCWLWTGTTSGSNARYGYFQVGTKSHIPKVPAHRVSYKLFVGPIPEGMEIDHVLERGCTSKLCVNPAHLEPVTHAENRRRGRLTTCRSGKHDLTDPSNMRWDNKGQRRGCLQCWKDRAEERKRARKVK